MTNMAFNLLDIVNLFAWIVNFMLARTGIHVAPCSWPHANVSGVGCQDHPSNPISDFEFVGQESRLSMFNDMRLGKLFHMRRTVELSLIKSRHKLRQRMGT